MNYAVAKHIFQESFSSILIENNLLSIYKLFVVDLFLYCEPSQNHSTNLTILKAVMKYAND